MKMTRYAFSDSQGKRWFVGYDVAVASYFAQVDKPEDACTVAGNGYGEVRSVDALKETLKGQVQLPRAIEDALRATSPEFVDDKAASAAQARVRETYRSLVAAPPQSLER